MSELARYRDIDEITTEILDARRVGGEAILTIGKGLIEAKAMLGHGEWLPWLTEKVEFSPQTANRFMKLAREWTNPSALSDLGATKALALLALPESEREAFIQSTHEVNGKEKPVIDMTARELEQAIKERDEARKELAELKARPVDVAVQEVEVVREVERPNPFDGDDSLLQFKILFDQAQETVNKMHGLLLKVRNSDADSAERLGKALLALSKMVGEAAA